jgi:RNA polymerase sigma-70 factor (ECF subfamily)
MRIATATPTQEMDEIRAHECDRDHPEKSDVDRQRLERKVLEPSVRDVMLAAVPSLRAFAMSLSGKRDRADDLVQGTLLRAIANIQSFQPGTNMSAWLFTILHNLFRSEFRKRRREVEDADGGYSGSLKSAPEQDGRIEFKELFKALAKLPLEQREALLLVGASRFSYQDAAAICETAVGTIKSRVNRARQRLAELLELDNANNFGPGSTTPKRKPVSKGEIERPKGPINRERTMPLARQTPRISNGSSPSE